MTIASTASPRKRSMRRSRPSSAAYGQALTAERTRRQMERKLTRAMLRGAEYLVSSRGTQTFIGGDIAFDRWPAVQRQDLPWPGGLTGFTYNHMVVSSADGAARLRRHVRRPR